MFEWFPNSPLFFTSISLSYSTVYTTFIRKGYFSFTKLKVYIHAGHIHVNVNLLLQEITDSHQIFVFQPFFFLRFFQERFP